MKYPHSFMKFSFRTAIAASASLIWQASAANLTWDITPGTVGAGDGAITGGDGNWDLSAGNWTTDAGVNNIAWTNGPDVAIFGGTAGTVTVAEPLSAAGLTFTANGYLVTGSKITLTGTPISAAGMNVEIASEIAGTVGLSAQGTGSYLKLSGANSYTGATSIVASASVIATNSTAFGGTADGTTVSNLGNLTLSGGVDISGETLSVRGAGPEALAPFSGGLRNLSGDNSWTGDITLSNSLRVVCDSGTLTVGKVNMGTRSLILTGPGNLTANGDLSGTTGAILVDMLNNTAATGGTLTLKGADTFTGAMTVTNGKLSLEGNRTAASGALMVGNGAAQIGTLHFKAGNFNTGSNWIQVGEATGTGIVNHTAGTLGTVSGGSGLILVGSGVDSTGTYNLSGGELFARANNNNALILGTNSGSVGEFNLSDTGALTMNGGASAIMQIGRCNSTTNNADGTFNQTGGTAVLRNIAMGGGGVNNVGTDSILNLTGGVFDVRLGFTTFSAGIDSSSAITIGGTADVTLPAFPTARGTSTISPSGFSTATITFDGGTLRPTATSATYMGGLDSAKIQDGGITFNVDTGKDITINQDLLTDDVSLGGGITKAGAGALVLAGVNTYTGATLVNEGTLGLGITGVIDASSAVTVASGATFGGSGTASGTVMSSGSIRPGTLGVGTLTTGPTTLTAGSLDIEVSDTTAGNLLSSGALNVTAINLNVTELVAGSATSYVIAEGSSITGPFNSETLPPGYSVTFTATQAVLNRAASATYATWAAAYASAVPPLTDVTTTGDPDNDGLNNLMEYALGLDPRFSSGSPGTSTNGGMTITFTKGAEAKVNLDVLYRIETSATLGVAPNPWTEASAPVVTETSDTISITFPAGPSNNFARLKVVQIP